MGNSCTCIKDTNQNEVETFDIKEIKVDKVVLIQKNWKGAMARQELKKLKQQS